MHKGFDDETTYDVHLSGKRLKQMFECVKKIHKCAILEIQTNEDFYTLQFNGNEKLWSIDCTMKNGTQYIENKKNLGRFVQTLDPIVSIKVSFSSSTLISKRL